MKLRISFILFTALFAYWAEAKHVTVENAQSIAQKYYGQTTGGGALRSAQTSFSLAYIAKREATSISPRSAQSDDEDAYFYIFNAPDNEGFIIVAADDRAYPVLGYSFKGAFDYDQAPPVFMQWLKNYQEEIEEALNADSPLETNPEWQKIEDGMKLRSAGTILGTAEWHQEDPFNRQCPQIGSQRAVTGCVATAMAIVMKYHASNGFAATGTGSHSYTYKGQTYSATFGSYDYANMPNTISGFTNETQRNAVARLMFHCGVSVEAEYGAEITNAVTPYIAKALPFFFGFDQSSEFLSRSSFDDASWKNLIRTEIDNYRPIVYNGHGSAGGHAFICEGYTVSDEYAFNWGWGGYCNGYFLLSALVPISGYNFSTDQGMIIGMKRGTGSTTPNQLWVSTADGKKGMTKSVQDISQNMPFNVSSGAVENFSYTSFTGRIAVALTDQSGNVKEIISAVSDRSSNPLLPDYYTSMTFNSCRISTVIASNDLLRLVFSTDNGASWKIIYGRTGVVDFLTLGNQSIAVTGVSLNINSRTINVNESFQLTATVAPSNATNKNVSWSSNNTSVATVSATGLVTASAAGTAVITVTTDDGSKTASCTITVLTPTISVTGVSLNTTARTLNVNESFQLTATVAPSNATNKNISWSSNNTSVATVSASGLVTARAAGTAIIRVTTADGSKTATCTVTVTSPYLASGTAGPLTWILSHEGMLTFSGNGAMPDYTDIQKAPWQGYVSSIKSIEMAGGITKIGNYAFASCSNITSINIPSTVSDLGSHAFYNCTGLTSVSLPNTISNIKPYTFYACKFKTLVIQSSVTRIESYAYASCGIVSLTIPNTVNHLGLAAFSSNPLTEVFIDWPTPLILESSPFTGVNLSATTLQIPDGTKSLYDKANIWQDFGNIVEEGGTGEKDLLSTPTTARLQGNTLYVTSASDEVITLYSLTGNVLYQAKKPIGAAIFKISDLPRGIFIIHGSSGWTRKVVFVF